MAVDTSNGKANTAIVSSRLIVISCDNYRLNSNPARVTSDQFEYSKFEFVCPCFTVTGFFEVPCMLAPNSKYRSMVTLDKRGKRKRSCFADENDQTPAEKRALIGGAPGWFETPGRVSISKLTAWIDPAGIFRKIQGT